jgi:cytidine deaminase
MRIKKIETEFNIYENLAELPIEIQEIQAKAIEAINNSYSPYSNFKVGAALITNMKRVFLGSNQENGAYPNGICAERVAMFQYGANKKEGEFIEIIAVTAESEQYHFTEPVSPCGECLQAMSEFEYRQEEPFTVVLFKDDTSWVVKGIKNFLPLNFKLNLKK